MFIRRFNVRKPKLDILGSFNKEEVTVISLCLFLQLFIGLCCTRGASKLQEWYHRGTRKLVQQISLMFKYMDQTEEHRSGNYSLIGDQENNQLSLYDKPLPCCGCGIGWFSLLLGFIFPVMWYYATILYFGNYYQKDPRERTGLAACAIAALIFTIVVLITVAIIVL